MFSLKNKLSFIFGITIGSLLYVILNFIPLIGPFLAGVTTGKFSRNLKQGILGGFLSGVVGSLLVFFIFSNWLYTWSIFGKFLAGSFLLIWNLVGIIFTTLGGIIGSAFSFQKRIWERFTPEKEEEEVKRKILVVCKNCKTANPKGREYCKSCGEKL